MTALDTPAVPETDEPGAETERIRAAYARRQWKDSRYSCFDDAHLLLVQERERHVLAALKRNGISDLEGTRILEIGSGSGHWLREFIKWGGRPENIIGLDLIADRVAEAKLLCPGAVRIECGHAGDLPFPGEAFDLVLQSTVFSSILDVTMRRQVAAEMLRVVKRDGIVLWYDLSVNNPWNADVRRIGKHEVRQLFPGCRIELRRVTLAPPVARVLARYSWAACSLLAQMRWLCTHYLGVIRKV
jgi:ubiquinone/menaquinone biosynthesis C-methylase UbiE